MISDETIRQVSNSKVTNRVLCSAESDIIRRLSQPVLGIYTLYFFYVFVVHVTARANSGNQVKN